MMYKYMIQKQSIYASMSGTKIVAFLHCPLFI